MDERPELSTPPSGIDCFPVRPRMAAWRYADRALLALLALWAAWRFIIVCRGYWAYTVDDAYITLRHARNLVEGNGFVYNPGGPNVESYTNHLLFLCQALVLWLGGDGLFWTKVLGVTGGLATMAAALCLGWLLIERFREGDQVLIPLAGLAAAPLLLSRNPTLFTGSVSGLETSLFTAFVTWGGCLSLLLLEERPSRWLDILWGVVLGLATWIRPEGIAWLAGFLAAVACLRYIQRYELRRLLLPLMVALSLWLVLLLWRLIIFGHPAPNTYYAKMGQPLASRLANGTGYITDFLFPNAGLWLLLFAGAGLLARGRRRRWAIGVVLAAVIGGIAVAWYEGGDWIPHLRMISPVIGLLAGVMAAGLVLATSRIPRIGAVLALIVPLAAWQVYYHASMPGLRRAAAEIQTRIFGWNDAHLPLGKWFGEWNAARQAAGRETLVVAIEDIGLVGWYGRVDIIDLAGLADPLWAHMHYDDPGSPYPAQLLLHERNPHAVVIVSQSGHRQPTMRIDWRTNRAVYTHPDFAPNFTEVAMFTHKDFPGDGLFLHLFVRNDLLEEVPPVTPPIPRAVGQ